MSLNLEKRRGAAPRPRILAAVVALFGLAAASTAQAQAQAWPAKPVRVVVPFATGGGTDLMSRIIAEELRKRLGQTFVVENIAGAGGVIGAGQVAKAAPDGYTLMAGTPGTMVINPHLMTNISYNALKDFAPITQISSSPAFLMVAKDFPVNSVKELIDLARKDPGAINYASTGVGSFAHLSGELFATRAGVKMTHIAYKGTAPAMTDLSQGRVQMMLNLVLPDDPQVRSGAVRVIAVGTQTPSELFPKLPLVSATVPGYESSTWMGWLAPAGTPPAIIDRVYQAAAGSLKDPATRQKIQSSGGGALGSSPQEFSTFIAEKYKEMAELVKVANIPKM
jgi:tripartite-type tricarboxylate transporter receptor subunit TctC